VIPIKECKCCGFVGEIDYYNKNKNKKSWIIIFVGPNHDVLKCPNCEKETINKAK